MKIAVVLNAHNHTDIVLDTIHSIHTYVTKNILVVVDGCSWKSWGENVQLPAYKMQGMNHGHIKGPYRNLTLGLMNVSKLFSDVDWYCYCEYDVLFANDHFKQDLEEMSKHNVWVVGADARIENMKFPLLEAMLNEKIEKSHYTLGCCVFYHRDFIFKLHELNFYERFLNLTNDFPRDFFPQFEEQGGYDLGEHLYPTLAGHYGGKVAGFSAYKKDVGIWTGNYRRYPLRWKPELDITENFPESSILHPVKKVDHPIRQERRLERI